MVDFKSNEEAMATFCSTSIAILQTCGLEEATVSFTDASGEHREHYEVVIRRAGSAADEEDDT